MFKRSIIDVRYIQPFSSLASALIIILFVVSIPFRAQTGTPLTQDKMVQQKSDLPNPYTVMERGLIKNNYLSPILELQLRESEYLSSPQWKESYLEYMPLLYSYVSDFDSAYFYEEKLLEHLEPMFKFRQRNAKDLESSPIDSFNPLNAIQAISSIADKHQVIMINEEHRTPAHRAFTLQLLSTLYKKGFRYFAAETVEEDEVNLNKRCYPTQQTGAYTADPVYADLIRTALKLGFKIIPYEHNMPCTDRANPAKCQDERERGQAQNLYERILKKDPNAKTLVHVGRAHNAKSQTPQFSFMAWHFREISKINPFTIDQVRFSERRNSADEFPLYRYVTSKGLIKEPAVFQSPDGKFYTEGDSYDLRVFHPRAKYKNGRPTWLAMGDIRKPVSINFKKLKLATKQKQFSGQEPVLVQAFYQQEGIEAIPVDQVMLYPLKETSVLMLPKGAILVRAVDKQGNVIGSYKERLK